MLARPTGRQTNLLLAVLVVTTVITGVISWAVGTGEVRVVTAVHGIAGFAIVVLTPVKLRTSVRTGMRRGRMTRWLSIAFGLLVITVVALGVLHSTGLWFGVGYWSALWTHTLLGFVLLPLFAWHLLSRPVRPRATDLDRRAVLVAGSTAAVATVAYGAQELVIRATGLAGGDRRATGSHEIASFDPTRMPTVSWIDDSTPTTPPEEWELRIGGRIIDLDQLRTMARPLDAVLDCTGGWWSEQRWDVVPVAEVLSLDTASFSVRSATGYARRFPASDAADVHLAVGYGGGPLRRGHGAPVRIVAPGRRGPWWVKWVTEVEPDDRPWWFQLPFPAT
ncbi:MAG: molybdopterin-dependent oxidoreductase [Actinomycetota bacterium]